MKTIKCENLLFEGTQMETLTKACESGGREVLNGAILLVLMI